MKNLTPAEIKSASGAVSINGSHIKEPNYKISFMMVKTFNDDGSYSFSYRPGIFPVCGSTRPF